MVITEFDAGDPEATMHAMATEILRYRHCVSQLADADRRESWEAMCETVRTITELVEQLDRRFVESSGILAVDGG